MSSLRDTLPRAAAMEIAAWRHRVAGQRVDKPRRVRNGGGSWAYCDT
jgi:hypothetical protein